jgi:CBS domain-containing protein
VTERRIARETPVSACVGVLAIEPLLVRPADDLIDVLRRASAQPQTRVIGVVDDAGRLVGVLPILRLAEAVIARVTPAALMVDLDDVEDVARFGHAVGARTAGDAMLPPISTPPTATVGEAFRQMHRRRISGMYVVDDHGRPTGYLDLLELAAIYVEAIVGDGRAGPHEAG